MMESGKLEVVYLDVMVEGRHVLQLPYPHRPDSLGEARDIVDYVLSKKPSPKYQDMTREFSNQRVI